MRGPPCQEDFEFGTPLVEIHLTLMDVFIYFIKEKFEGCG